MGQYYNKPFANTALTLIYGLLTYILLLLSPFLLSILRPHSAFRDRLSTLVDRNWSSLPAFTQLSLYECGYRNLDIESLPTSERRQAFPPTPSVAPTSLRIIQGRTTQDTDRAIQGDPKATVFGWPSTGGLWAKKVTVSELPMFGLPVTAISTHHGGFRPATLPSEEDTFCQVLRDQGADFYRSISDYRLAAIPRLGYDEDDLEL